MHTDKSAQKSPEKKRDANLYLGSHPFSNKGSRHLYFNYCKIAYIAAGGNWNWTPIAVAASAIRFSGYPDVSSTVIADKCELRIVSLTSASSTIHGGRPVLMTLKPS